MNNEFDDIFSTNTTNEQIEVLEVEDKPPKKKFKLDLKNDKVLMVQLILIGIWILLTVIIYFFGYPLFEAFIEV